MLNKPGVTESLARHVVATRWEDIPLHVRHQAKRSLINFFAVTLAGCRSGPVEIALRSLAEFSGGRQVTVVGRTERLAEGGPHAVGGHDVAAEHRSDTFDVELHQRTVRSGAPHGVTVATAEIAMLLLLGSARRASEGERMVRARAWPSSCGLWTAATVSARRRSKANGWSRATS